MTDNALVVDIGVPGSARLDDLPDDAHAEATVEIAPWLVGLCGTDAEIVAGRYGEAPPGETRLVIGHEAVVRVVSAPEGSALSPGQLLVPIVRRPDPVPCTSCAAGEWDMCTNGRYTEHGIRAAHGYARTRAWLDPDFAVAVPAALGELAVLVEPASIVAKAWEQIERIGRRASWQPNVVLVTGAGPIGLLATLMARQRGFETHVLDRVERGVKPQLVQDIGATYHASTVDRVPRPDIVIECTGAGSVVLDVIEHSSRSGVVCLTGLSTGRRTVELDAAAVNRRIVLENDVVFGTVNANRRHYEAAVVALAHSDSAWLERLITRRVGFDDWRSAFERDPDDVKVVLVVS